ncbi:hypothetical protein [Nonomuraea sp. NPDC049646]|uniref:hypothetical protein n=1 Tax=unclassified Nonomuraea TaxID=2593643 RepID=UPI0037BA9B8A
MMARRRTTLLEAQPALFDDDAPQPPTLEMRITRLEHKGHPRPPRRDKEWNELVPCAPECLACGAPEPPEDAPAWPLCPSTGGRCATVCAHTADAYRADLCLITTHVHAELVTLPETGRTVAVVACPYCEHRHAHGPTPGRHYRTSKCRTGRKPYIVTTNPEATP